jgi:hypothetical protein
MNFDAVVHPVIELKRNIENDVGGESDKTRVH